MTFAWSLAAAATIASIALTGCTSTTVHTGSLDTAPYAQFRTFSFAPAGSTIEGYRSTPRGAQVIDLMKPAITTVLQAKGYAAAEADADLVIVCSAGSRNVEEHIRLPRRIAAAAGEEYEDRDFVEGAVIIDVFDKSGGQVWHGSGQTEIDPNKPNDARVRSIVESVLKTFPSHAKQ